MDTDGLSIICAGLGYAEEDDDSVLIGYTKSEYCLDNLKDLQRFLRRDDLQRRDVFKQICKWNTVPRDLVPIIEFYQSDRNLVINAVKVLVFLTMPIDPASDDIAQQMEYLWDLKAAMTRYVTIAVVVSLLEDPLEHLERDAFTEDDWKLVQLVLTLFRNILAIQGVTLQQKASGSATQFLCLTDKFLELMFQENVMDLILVLAQHVDDPCGYLHQDNLLLLEIFHCIFQGRDPELIAGASKKGSKVDGDITISVESLRSIMEEEEDKRRFIRQRNLERHSQFSGTFTRLAMDGSKTLFKGNPASASGDGLLKIHKVPRGPLKKIAWDHGSLSLPKENILELLRNFLNQFLSGGYNGLMQSIRDDIKKEHQDIQNIDVIIFFQVAQFVIAFQHQKVLLMQKLNMERTTSEASLERGFVDDLSFHGDLCGPIAATINEAMFYLVISKWREAFESLKETNDRKSLSAAGSLMKNMIRMLDLVLKLLPEDSKEPQTARILLYKMFYDQTEQGLTQFLLNFFRSFDTHKQPKSDLADLLEIVHIVFRLMEKLQARGTLRVSRKSRKGRRKRTTKDNSEVESARLRGEHSSPQNVDDQTNETEKPTSQSFLDSNKIKDNTSESSSGDKEGTLTSNPAVEPDMPLQDTGYHKDDSSDCDKVNNNHNDLMYETEDSSDDDQLPATSEVDFNVSKLVSSFANNAVIQNLCWLLKYYKSNSANTNHYIICMLQRFCDDLELSPMLYQLSLLTTFYDILADQKSSKSKEYANIVHFLTKFARKMMKIMKSQPLLFVEILFWKTRKECHCINAETLMCDLVHLKNDIKSLDSEIVDLSNYKGKPGYKSISDSLGDDEAHYAPPPILNNQREENSSDVVHKGDMQDPKQSEHKGNDMVSILNDEMNEDKSESTLSDLRTQETFRSPILDQEQEATIKHLYEKYKDDRRCSRLIAEALGPDGNISPLQVSCKLKQLGLKVSSRRKLARSGVPFPSGDDPSEVVRDTFTSDSTLYSSNKPDDNSYSKTSSRTRKRIRAFSKEQELEVKVLFERFKNHKKCNHMIANALDADNTYTAAQVSRKLRQLGLLAPQVKRSSKAAKQSGDPGDKETIDREDQSDEETLLAIKERSRRKKSKPLVQEATMTSISQHPQTHDSDDEILSTMFKDVIGQRHESDPTHKGGHEAVDSVALADNIEVEMDSTSIREEDGGMSILYQQEQQTHDELMDLEDSGDDLGPVVSRKMGSRRNLKMVIDVEDDE